jgi:hypothetical protein
MCVRLSLQLSSDTFLIPRRNEQDVIKNVYWSSRKLPSILVRVSRKLNFLDRFSKNNQMPIFMKIRSVGAELFHMQIRTGGETHDEDNSHFSKFWEHTKKFHFLNTNVNFCIFNNSKRNKDHYLMQHYLFGVHNQECVLTVRQEIHI